ncbi:hypothetical protein PIROE2DRAFT_62052 [Piromyces sp. E2]|nr:hypothetical protein PIROE2DRAFT_62052 [Piromyces sp. E2]|eukprot:OUM62197.1 hypothetical protein PIROE2DRAFT_62052 [Piromyces sp. E2]
MQNSPLTPAQDKVKRICDLVIVTDSINKRERTPGNTPLRKNKISTKKSKTEASTSNPNPVTSETAPTTNEDLKVLIQNLTATFTSNINQLSVDLQASKRENDQVMERLDTLKHATKVILERMNNLEVNVADKDNQLADIRTIINKATQRVDTLATPITASVLRTPVLKTPREADGDVVMRDITSPHVSERMLSFSGKSIEVPMKVNFIEDCLEGDAAAWYDAEQAISKRLINPEEKNITKMELMKLRHSWDTYYNETLEKQANYKDKEPLIANLLGIHGSLYSKNPNRNRINSNSFKGNNINNSQSFKGKKARITL